MPSKNDLVGHRNPRRFRRNTSIFSTGTAHGANYPSANGTFRVFIGIDRMMTRPASCGAIIHFISSLLEKASLLTDWLYQLFQTWSNKLFIMFQSIPPPPFLPSCHKYSTNCGFIPILKKRNPRKHWTSWGFWLRRRDLNPRPSGYEPDELPNCSTPRYWLLRAYI